MRILQDSAVLEELILLAGYISDDNEKRHGISGDATFSFGITNIDKD